MFINPFSSLDFFLGGGLLSLHVDKIGHIESQTHKSNKVGSFNIYTRSLTRQGGKEGSNTLSLFWLRFFLLQCKE